MPERDMLLKPSPRNCVETSHQAQVETTRACLGLNEPHFVSEGCDRHYGVHIPDSLTRNGVRRTATVMAVPRRQGDHDVQQELDAASRAIELSGYATSTKVGRCPLCPSDDASRVRFTRAVDRFEPRLFFVVVERERACDKGFTAPRPSPAVAAYGQTYRLIAVIHKVVNGNHFICQALQNGCWHVYDGVIEPCLLAYVREEGKETEERERERETAKRTHKRAATRMVSDIREGRLVCGVTPSRHTIANTHDEVNQ